MEAGDKKLEASLALNQSRLSGETLSQKQSKQTEKRDQYSIDFPLWNMYQVYQLQCNI